MKAAYTKPFLVALLIIIADQLIKIWVHSHMYQGQEIKFLGDRGMLHYTENNGMAFGMELGGDFFAALFPGPARQEATQGVRADAQTVAGCAWQPQ